MAEPSTSLAGQIKELLPKLRQIAGEDRKPILCFDRGGWSPDLFAEIIDARFDLLTYRKAERRGRHPRPARGRVHDRRPRRRRRPRAPRR